MEPPNQFQNRLKNLIAEAKKLPCYPGITWEASVWDVTKHEVQGGHYQRKLSLRFGIPEGQYTKSPIIPFEPEFADFAKTIISFAKNSKGRSYSCQRQLLQSLRLLYQSLKATGCTGPTELTRRHFTAALEQGRQLSHRTAYMNGQQLVEIARFVDEKKLTKVRINFKNFIKPPELGDGLDAASQAKGLKKMPSKEIFEVLAKIYQNPGDPNEQILMSIMCLLLVGGFRIGEVLTLPVNCWQETERFDLETQQKVATFAIRYWPEKGGLPVAKQIPPGDPASLALKAIETLTQLCKPARNAAQILEENPHRVPISGIPDRQKLVTCTQLMGCLGFRSSVGVRGFLRKLGIQPIHRDSENAYSQAGLYSVDELEKALVQKRSRLKVVQNNDYSQTLSESLCVAFPNQFNSLFPTFTFLPILIQYHTIQGQFDGDRKNSIFEKRKLSFSDGTPMKVKTHAFRHWLNTMAARGGMTDLELALWMGRKNISQNQAYIHGTAEERAAWVREGIKQRDLYGTAAETYHFLNDPIQKEWFIQTFVNVAHFTPYGVCIHDYSIEPCEKHLNCLSGCKDYLRTKGNQKEIQALVQLRRHVKDEIRKIEDDTLAGDCVNNNWLDFNHRRLAAIDKALAIEDDSSGLDGDPVSVFPNGTSVGRPFS